MTHTGGHVHKRWLDRDPYSDCDSYELLFFSFYEFDSEGWSGYGEE